MKNFLVYAIYIGLAAVSCSLAAKERLVDYPYEGTSVGAGWRSDIGDRVIGSCIAFKEVSDPSQTTLHSYKRVQNQASLSHLMDISTEFKAGGLIKSSGSAKMHFVNDSKVTTDDLNIAVRIVVVNGRTRVEAKDSKVDAPTVLDLTPHYAQMAKTDPVLFRAECGDAFVSSITSGAELDAILHFDANDSTIKNSIYGEVAGSLFGQGGSATALKTDIQTRFHSNLEITYIMLGGVGGQMRSALSDENSFNQLTATVAPAAAAFPQGWKIGIRSYGELPSLRGVDLPGRIVRYDALANRILRLQSLYLQLGPVVDNHGLYLNPAGSSNALLDGMRDEIRDKLTALKSQLTRCVHSDIASDCTLAPDDRESDYVYLWRIPVLGRSFPEGRQFLDAQTRLRKAQSRWQRFANDNGFFDQGPKAHAVAELTAAGRAFDEARVELIPAFEEAIYRQRVADVSAAYCEEDQADINCLSEAQKRQWRDKIHRSVYLPFLTPAEQIN